MEIIRQLKEDFWIVVDPHTADGVSAAQQHKLDTPVIVLETALPVKFSRTIYEAIEEYPRVPERFKGIMDAERHVTDLPNDTEAVKQFIANAIDNTDNTDNTEV